YRMTGCSAPNCVNSYRKGFRLHSFPRNSERRKRWAINMRRRNKNGGAWVPPTHARLCDAHFEECQFETGRKDGWKKLKLTAIPTLFDVPNPPKKFATQRRVLTRNTDIPEISPLLATPKTTDHSYVRPNEKKQLSTSKENQSREDECTDNADTRSIAEPDPCSTITVSDGKDLEIRRWRRSNTRIRLGY
ncbi:PREDICTED: THAP domain-containing protein 2-like, partial [Priapulus caudatus]|uniref:THAP domain-containing protein 2-like n=1 Tax=Priapulus caudatus TaxID=37621 RepID=A0ABM1F7N3_PRICU